MAATPKRLAQWKNYRDRNREKLRERDRIYRETNVVSVKAKLDRYHKSFKGRYANLKNKAKHRGLPFELSLDDYRRVVNSGVCYFCGGTLPTNGSGVDRLDNRLGYVRGNCISCCWSCNTIKGRVEGLGFVYPRTMELLKEILRIRSVPKATSPIPLPSVFAMDIQQIS